MRNHTRNPLPYGRYWAAALLALVLSLLTGSLHAQAPARPLVAFVLENDIQTASISDTGPDGVSRLAEIFESYGADARFIRLNEAIPDEAKVIVLPRPQRAISADNVARIWRHLNRGNNLLVAIDPLGYPSTRTERSTGGLGRLLYDDYGVTFEDSFVAEPWFAREALAKTTGSVFHTHYYTLADPAFQPLVTYELPVQMWGARSVFVEALGMDSEAIPLLYTDSAYADRNPNLFVTNREPAAIEPNLENDSIGWVPLAGVGQNLKNLSRVVVLGDSELIQNGYGLRRVTNRFGQEVVLYPGNQVMVERMVVWLLEVPQEDWKPLPAGYTWLAMDGDGSDWPESIETLTNEDTGDIASIRTFRNDSYLYLQVAANVPLSAETDEVRLIVNPVGSSSPPVTLLMNASNTAILSDEGRPIVPDAGMAVGKVIEIRIPLRVTNMNVLLDIDQVCLLNGNGESCLNQSFTVRQVNEADPVPLRVANGPLVTLDSPSSHTVNLRREPSTDANVVAILNNGTLMAAVGRNAAGDWVKVMNAGFSGWLSSVVITVNGDIMALPLAES